MKKLIFFTLSIVMGALFWLPSTASATYCTPKTPKWCPPETTVPPPETTVSIPPPGITLPPPTTVHPETTTIPPTSEPPVEDTTTTSIIDTTTTEPPVLDTTTLPPPPETTIAPNKPRLPDTGGETIWIALIAGIIGAAGFGFTKLARRP